MAGDGAITAVLFAAALVHEVSLLLRGRLRGRPPRVITDHFTGCMLQLKKLFQERSIAWPPTGVCQRKALEAVASSCLRPRHATRVDLSACIEVALSLATDKTRYSAGFHTVRLVGGVGPPVALYPGMVLVARRHSGARFAGRFSEKATKVAVVKSFGWPRDGKWSSMLELAKRWRNRVLTFPCAQHEPVPRTTT